MKNILIIDDCEADQFLSKFLIQKISPNVSISQAYDGIEALDLLEKMKEAPDVIFIDINMPRMNGYEFLKIYSQKYDNKPKIFILTSSNESVDQERSHKFECVESFITKPITNDLISQLL